MTWIAVENEMPDDELIVLVYMPDSCEPVWLGYHVTGEGWQDIEGGAMQFDVIHWRELPEPPEIEA